MNELSELLESFLANPALAAVALVVGCGALVLGGEWLVRGATRIALGFRVTPLVVGLTVVAFATSAPEMAVSFSAVFRSSAETSGNVADVAIGNIVGSNICNIFLILGVCGLIRPLRASETIVKRDFPIYVGFAVFALVSAFLFVDEFGRHYFPRALGAVLLLAFVLYEVYSVVQARKEENAKHAANVVEENVIHRQESGFKRRAKNDKNAKKVKLQDAKDEDAARPPKGFADWAIAIALFVAGLAMLVVGAKLFVGGAVSIARAIHVSELVIGLTVVAIGTSLPELTVSAVATRRNQVDVALGNVVGSNICNTALILGVTTLALPGGVPLDRQTVLIDLPLMTIAGALAAWFCFTDRKLERWEACALLVAQIGYVVYLAVA